MKCLSTAALVPFVLFSATLSSYGNAGDDPVSLEEFASVLARGAGVIEVKFRATPALLGPRAVEIPIDPGALPKEIRERLNGRSGEGRVDAFLRSGTHLRRIPAQFDPPFASGGPAYLTVYLQPGRVECDLLVVVGESGKSLPYLVKSDFSGPELTVNNGVFIVTHPVRGGGGMPKRIGFPGSGEADAETFLDDRVFRKDAGYFTLSADPESEVRKVVSGPLRAVVRAKARYIERNGGRATESNASAVYDFTYLAGSPLVKVTAFATQDAAFEWPELRFLQVSNKSTRYHSWAGGEPAKTESLLDNDRSFNTDNWACMFNETDCVGLIHPGIVSYDGRTSYYNYVMCAGGGWKTKEQRMEAHLYIGPSGGDGHFVRQAWMGMAEKMEVKVSTPESMNRLAGLLSAEGYKDNVLVPRPTVGLWGGLIRGVDHLIILALRCSMDGREVEAAQILGVVQKAQKDKKVLETILSVLEKGGGQSISEKTKEDKGAAKSLDNILLNAQVAPGWIGNAIGLSLWFARWEEGGGLAGLGSGIASLTRQTEFRGNAENAPTIWRIELRRAEDGKVVTLDNTGRACAVERIRPEDPYEASHPLEETEVMLLHWKGIDVENEKSALDVTVKITPTKKGFRWRIKVDNRCKEYGLWSVDFPYITGLGKAGETELVYPGRDWGFNHKRFSGSVGGTYPSAGWTMQFLGLIQGREGLYLAAEDPAAACKTFHFSPGKEFYVRSYPPDMSLPGVGYDMPYDFVMARTDGDWFSISRRYREWATQQSWTSRGKLSARADKSDKFNSIAFWICDGGFAKDVVPRMLKLKELLPGIPIGIHWYNWHVTPFDTHYPNYFPFKEGFDAGVKVLVDNGIYAMPYINGRLWDKNGPGYDGAIPYTTKDVNGESWTEEYGNGVKQAVMCPNTQFWQDTETEVIRKLTHEVGVNAVYIDQVASAGPQLCFDKSHGHNLGGADAWVSGYYGMLEKIRKTAKAAGPDVCLTTENNAEPYMAYFDGQLIWLHRQQEQVPLFEAVYGDYVNVFATRHEANESEMSFRLKFARDFIWGNQVGWIGLWITDPQHKDKIEFLKNILAYRFIAKKFLVYGEMMPPPEIVSSVPTLKADWPNPWSVEHIKLPAVMTSLWKAEDGTYGLIAVNADTRQQAVTIELNLDQLDGMYGSGGEARVGRTVFVAERVTSDKRVPFGILSGSQSMMSFDVPSGGVAFFELRKATDEILTEFEQTEFKSAVQSYRFGLRTEGQGRLISTGGNDLKLGITLHNSGQREVKSLALRCGAARPRAFDSPSLGTGKYSGAVITVPAPDAPPGSAVLIPYEVTCKVGEEACVIKDSVVVHVREPIETTLELPEKIHAGDRAWVKATIRSFSGKTSDGRLALDVPDGWRVSPGKTVRYGPLATGAEQEFFFEIEVPPGQRPSSRDVRLSVLDELGKGRIEVLPPRRIFQAPRLKNPLTIDGDLSDWPADAPAIVLDGKSGNHVEKWGGESDLSAKVRIAWDDANAYFAIEVKDQTHDQPNSGFNIWQGDCVQLAFRSRRGMESAGGGGDCAEFGLALTKSGPQIFQWFPRQGVFNDGALKVVRGDGVTTYEASLPLKSLELNPANADRDALFSLTVNDADGDADAEGAGFKGWLEWTPGICGSKDSNQFGILEFTK